MKTRLSASKGRYQTAGAILACFKEPETARLKYNLETEKKFEDGDLWIAIVRTKRPLSAEQLRQFFDDYQEDPDKKGTPYYFAVKDADTKELFVVYNDEFILHPLQTRAQREAAKQLGMKKGILAEQVDFVGDEISGKEFAE